jgi:predicted 2-oxoglutarate/Fe(II)-dependent dioxygenase YbiX
LHGQAAGAVGQATRRGTGAQGERTSRRTRREPQKAEFAEVMVLHATNSGKNMTGASATCRMKKPPFSS